VESDRQGKPTVILTDRAKDFVDQHLPHLPEAVAHQVMDELLRDLAAHGLTGVHDMDSHREDVDVLMQRHSRGELPLRVYAARDSATSYPTDPMVATEDGLLTVRTVKFFGDGAMGSWSAAMLQPYNDRNSSGTLVYEREAFKRNVSAWAAKGYQVATHAIGDAANRQVLDVYAELLAGRPASETRWRVEHAQILAAEDLPRFAELGVIASMQPSHCASDLPYAVQRLGFQRASRSYAWSSLLRTGVLGCLSARTSRPRAPCRRFSGCTRP
jgi:predicted amidohydrolase YtcJ